MYKVEILLLYSFVITPLFLILLFLCCSFWCTSKDLEKAVKERDRQLQYSHITIDKLSNDSAALSCQHIKDAKEIKHLKENCKKAYTYLKTNIDSHPCEECKERDCGDKCGCDCHDEWTEDLESYVRTALQMIKIEED